MTKRKRWEVEYYVTAAVFLVAIPAVAYACSLLANLFESVLK